MVYTAHKMAKISQAKKLRQEEQEKKKKLKEKAKKQQEASRKKALEELRRRREESGPPGEQNINLTNMDFPCLCKAGPSKQGSWSIM